MELCSDFTISLSVSRQLSFVLVHRNFFLSGDCFSHIVSTLMHYKYTRVWGQLNMGGAQALLLSIGEKLLREILGISKKKVILKYKIYMRSI